ncbi:MAG: rRNA methyltransferase [Geobacter sp.]|nr:MAG: rRNA methyltransferase [Geobacter sp.]
MNDLRGAVPLSHLFLRERVRAGDRVVDATCGNGNDTLLLAKLVGPAGRVWGFDLQQRALDATREHLLAEGCLSQVNLVRAGHERLGEFVTESLTAVVFNLGYLPGGDKGVVTRPATTLVALNVALDLLLSGGILLVSVYTGHEGATDEEKAVLAWGSGLDPKAFNVWTSRQLNRPPTAPYLVLAQKRDV